LSTLNLQPLTFNTLQSVPTRTTHILLHSLRHSGDCGAIFIGYGMEKNGTKAIYRQRASQKTESKSFRVQINFKSLCSLSRHRLYELCFGKSENRDQARNCKT